MNKFTTWQHVVLVCVCLLFGQAPGPAAATTTAPATTTPTPSGSDDFPLFPISNVLWAQLGIYDETASGSDCQTATPIRETKYVVAGYCYDLDFGLEFNCEANPPETQMRVHPGENFVCSRLLNITYFFDGTEGDCLTDFPYGTINVRCGSTPPAVSEGVAVTNTHLGVGCTPELLFQREFHEEGACYQTLFSSRVYWCDCQSNPPALYYETYDDLLCVNKSAQAPQKADTMVCSNASGGSISQLRECYCPSATTSAAITIAATTAADAGTATAAPGGTTAASGATTRSSPGGLTTTSITTTTAATTTTGSGEVMTTAPEPASADDYPGFPTTDVKWARVRRFYPECAVDPAVDDVYYVANYCLPGRFKILCSDTTKVEFYDSSECTGDALYSETAPAFGTCLPDIPNGQFWTVECVDALPAQTEGVVKKTHHLGAGCVQPLTFAVEFLDGCLPELFITDRPGLGKTVTCDCDQNPPAVHQLWYRDKMCTTVTCDPENLANCEYDPHADLSGCMNYPSGEFTFTHVCFCANIVTTSSPSPSTTAGTDETTTHGTVNAGVRTIVSFAATFCWLCCVLLA